MPRAPRPSQEIYFVEGLKEARRSGIGTLPFTAIPSAKHVSADVRLTLAVSPDMLTLRRESRPHGSPAAFQPRGVYTLRPVATPLR